MIETKVFQVGPFQQNCRIMVNFKTRDGLIFDPGDDAFALCEFIEKNLINPKAIFLTHAHLDHAKDIDLVRDHFKIDVYMHKDEKIILEHINLQGGMFGLKIKSPRLPEHLINDGDMFEFLGTQFRAIHTPGHTPGGTCFYFETLNQIIVGDTLFAGSIGRSDLMGGNHDTLIESIKNKLLGLPENTAVLSGHGPDTTIGQEKKNNPFLT